MLSWILGIILILAGIGWFLLAKGNAVPFLGLVGVALGVVMIVWG